MEIVVTSDQEREELFAEIYNGEEQWAEVIYDPLKEGFAIKIYAPTSGSSYVFSLSHVQKVIEEAKCRLTRLGYLENEKQPIYYHSMPS